MRGHENETTEKYLKTILILSKVRPVVRCTDIAEELDIDKSSVSLALKNLRMDHYITFTKENFIYFTDARREIAEAVYERNEVLRNWLIRIGVEQTTAVEDARRIKHIVSLESIEAIKKSSKKLKRGPINVNWSAPSLCRNYRLLFYNCNLFPLPFSLE